MRVFWLSHTARIGGAELALAEGVQVLEVLGHEVHVVLPEEGELRDKLAPATSVQVVHSNRWMSRKLPSVAGRVRQLAYNVSVAAKAVSKCAESGRVEVVVTNTIEPPAGAFAASRCGLPHVWYAHEFGDLDHGRRFHWGRWATLRAIGMLSNVVLVNSEALRGHLEAYIPSTKLRLARYSVETPGALLEERPTRPFRLVLVAMKAPGKGQLDAIMAVHKLVGDGLDVRLDLVGGSDPGHEEELRMEVGRLGLPDRIGFVGFEREPWGWMSKAHAVLMCSRREAFGRVTVEAMKLGRPVIGARSGGTPELVRPGENGLLYDPGDADDLARQVRVLYDDPELGRAMGERGRAWACEQFTAERYGRDLEAALSEAVAAREKA